MERPKNEVGSKSGFRIFLTFGAFFMEFAEQLKTTEDEIYHFMGIRDMAQVTGGARYKKPVVPLVLYT